MEHDESRLQAYRALSAAAERIGHNKYRAGIGVIKRRGKVVGFSPTAEHAAVVAAMPKVLGGAISPDEAMALLHDHDVMEQRLRRPG